MFRVREGEIEQLGSWLISFPKKTIAHASGWFVIVAWPTAIEVDLERPLRLGRDPFQQVVAKGEGAGEAGHIAEHLRPLPSEVK